MSFPPVRYRSEVSVRGTTGAINGVAKKKPKMGSIRLRKRPRCGGRGELGGGMIEEPVLPPSETRRLISFQQELLPQEET